MFSTMKRWLGMLVLVAGGSVASAETTRASLGEGFDLVIANGGATVVKGKQRARLVEGVSIDKVKIDKAGRKVEVTLEDYSCASSHTYTWSYGYLTARLENTAAYALHKKKDYAGSAAGFAKAVAADPTWDVAAVNLASAQQLAGDKDGAIKTLAPWIASQPMAMYAKITSDAELSPLLERPEVKALRAAKPGDVKVTQDGIDGLVALQPDRQLIAVARKEASWGACFYETKLEIYDAAKGTLVAATPIVAWEETSDECDKGGNLKPKARAAVAKRIVALQTMLRDLGFKKVKTEVGTDVTRDEGMKSTSSIKKHKLGVVAQNDVVRVFQKDTELGRGAVLERLDKVVFVPDLRAVVAWSVRPGAEGCEGTDPTQVTVIPVSLPAAAATPAK